MNKEYRILSIAWIILGCALCLFVAVSNFRIIHAISYYHIHWTKYLRAILVSIPFLVLGIIAILGSLKLWRNQRSGAIVIACLSGIVLVYAAFFFTACGVRLTSSDALIVGIPTVIAAYSLVALRHLLRRGHS